MPRKLQIGIIGGRDVSSEIIKLAEETGRLLAEEGVIIVCGGLGGVMEAVCRGAKLAEGTTIGILPMNDPDAANQFVDIRVATGMGVARNSVIVNSCEGVIALSGRYGTLSEIAFALQKGIPVVSLKSWNIDDSVMKADSAEEAVKLILEKI